MAQADLENYFIEYLGGRNPQYAFVVWLRRTGLNTAIYLARTK